MSTHRSARRSAAVAVAVAGVLTLPLTGTAGAVDGTEPLVRSPKAAPESPESAAGFAQRPQGRAVQSAADTPPQIVYSVSNEADVPSSAVVRLNPLTGQVRTVVAASREFLSAEAWSAADGRIAYARSRDDDRDRVDSVPQAGGRGRAEVADASELDVSRDGRRVVFTRSRITSSDIFLANRGGTGVRRLTGAGGYNPRFSADGTRVVFTRTLRTSPGSDFDRQADLFTIRTDGTGLRRVTATDDRDESQGAFSPDGRRLLLTRSFTGPDSPASVYSIGVDGRGLRLVEANAFAPDWATNGWLTYLSFAGDRRPQLFAQDQVVVRSPGLPGRESVLTRETSFIGALRFAR